MRLREKTDVLEVTKRLVVPFRSVIWAYSAQGVKKEISSAELAALDTLSDELAIVSGLLATSDEINRHCDLSTRVVTITATGGISVAAHDGKTNLLAATATLVTLTLPAAVGSGARFRFVVRILNTSSYVFAVTGADLIQGCIMGTQDGGDTVVGWEAASDSNHLDFNGGSRGGAIGNVITLEDIATGIWSVSGNITQSGTEATPFSHV